MKLKLDDWQQKVLDCKRDICLCTGRQVGKSQIIGIKAAEFALKNPKNKVVIGAAIERQAGHIFRMVKTYLYDNYPNKIKGKATMSFVELTNDSEIRCVPIGDDGLGIRGLTATLLIIDEAAFVNPKAWGGIRPVLATKKGKGKKGQFILLSTPFGTEGYFADCYKNETFYRDHISSEDCPRITKEFLEGEKATMTKLQYQQEYLGLFVGGVQRFFPDELIDECCTIKEHKPTGKKYQGIDVARTGGDETVLVSFDRINKEKMVQFDLTIPEPQILTDTERLIIHKDKIINHTKIYIDTGGLGAGVKDHIAEHSRAMEKKVVESNNATRAWRRDSKGKEIIERTKPLMKELLYQNLKSLMEKGMIKIFNLPEVKQSLRSIQYENHEGEELRIYGNYTHITEAIIRAAWGIKDKSLNISRFYQNIY